MWRAAPRGLGRRGLLPRPVAAADELFFEVRPAAVARRGVALLRRAEPALLRPRGGAAAPACLRPPRTLRPLATAAAEASSAAPPQKVEEPAKKEGSAKGKEGSAKGKDDEEDKPMSWGRIFLYSVSTISGLVFVYYFRQAKYSFHQTEILLLDRFNRLPFYWPSGLPAAETNSTLCGDGLQPDLVAAFAEWFVATDLQEPGGVVREDVLELFEELGLKEEHPAAKDYLHRGEGQLEEHRRLSGTGLQESMSLLAKMSRPVDGVDSGELKPDAVDMLRRKTRRADTLAGGARAAMQQAMKLSAELPAAAAPAAAPADAAPGEAATAAAAAAPGRSASQQVLEDDDDGDMDEAQYRRSEVSRLQRLEDELMKKLERKGSLSQAEEARLGDLREQRGKLS